MLSPDFCNREEPLMPAHLFGCMDKACPMRAISTQREGLSEGWGIKAIWPAVKNRYDKATRTQS